MITEAQLLWMTWPAFSGTTHESGTSIISSMAAYSQETPKPADGTIRQLCNQNPCFGQIWATGKANPRC